MGHLHAHTSGSQLRLVLSISLNLLISVAEIIGGLLSGSLALLSDAVHNLNDTASLGISYAARRLNIQSAYLHIVSDAVSSVAVILGGIAILLFDVYWIDPVITIGIALYIAYLSLKLLRQTTHILMEGTPENLNPGHIAADLRQMSPVRDVHHVHIWQLDEHHLAFEAHVVIDEADLPRMEQIKRSLKERLLHRYGIGHVTLEFESRPCCDGTTAPPCHEPLPTRP